MKRNEMERKALYFLSGPCFLLTQVRAEGMELGAGGTELGPGVFRQHIGEGCEVPISSTFFFSPRFDSEGQALDGVSISDLRSGGTGGSNTNWKTLYEAKSENLGQGDKVPHTPHFRGPENDRRLNFCACSLVPAQSCVLIWDPRVLLQNTTLLLFSRGQGNGCAC